ncbi:CPBP family intramembrane glutamic endopeptidase [Prochlorococcus marinus]|uniref:CPBP family intramembrane glutamic endopeptidase n=1 Tax=Prochlorococcus marinus TaxID=1219 RepID=UPI0022B3B795|nr:CPBP family intramembrane glutamic endopeptidase [Prochlorococcus marinus]
MFFPILYLAGWLIAKFLAVFFYDLDLEDISLLGTIFSFIFFLLSLPSWVRLRWKQKESCYVLGLSFLDRQSFFRAFFRGFGWALGLIGIVLIPLLFSPWGSWVGQLNSADLVNAVFLGLGVGFAEELIFRGWLWSELNLFFNPQTAVLVQAGIFSFAHFLALLKSGLAFLELFALLFGLFLLGLVLALRRRLDRGVLSGCIGLHGGLVSIWFLINNSLVDLAPNTPSWLIGPGDYSPNPIGGIFGIVGLSCVLICYRTAFAIAGRPSSGERNASSKDAIP